MARLRRFVITIKCNRLYYSFECHYRNHIMKKLKAFYISAFHIARRYVPILEIHSKFESDPISISPNFIVGPLEQKRK